MPTIYRFNAVRVVVYPNDHRPAHVHLMDAKAEAVFNLNCPTGPVELRENFGFHLRRLAELKNLLETVLSDLCDKWSDIHGDQ